MALKQFPLVLTITSVSFIASQVILAILIKKEQNISISASKTSVKH